MTKATVGLVSLAMLMLGAGCGASVQSSRLDATSFRSSTATHSVQAMSADMLPGEYAVSWTGPSEKAQAREATPGLEYHPECASKKGRLIVGKLETTSFK